MTSLTSSSEMAFLLRLHAEHPQNKFRGEAEQPNAGPDQAAQPIQRPRHEAGAGFGIGQEPIGRARECPRGFPKSLHGAPALLPAENTTLRRALETWFRAQHIRPRVVAEFEDLALMKVMAAEGRGFIAMPTCATNDAVGHYGFQTIGKADQCRVQFHAMTAERRIAHPAVALITGKRLAGD
jgi:LysR family transcriptional activator of nhaA